ncbi:MAG: multidrug transporter [Lachnotalea sp.]
MIQWIQERELPFDISVEDAEILLDYLESQDYAIGQDKAGVLYRKDVGEELGEIEVYSMDEVIDVVCQWNYEKILEEDKGRNEPKDFIDFTEHQRSYEKLQLDEMRLDRLFDMTRFGREVEALAVKLANEFIENLNQNKEIDTAVHVVTEGVLKHSTGNRGR